MTSTKHINRKERILAAVQENTRVLIDQTRDEDSWVHAEMIAQQLGMDRANVARELNTLYRDGQLIKIQGKPTLYICRSVLMSRFPNVFFPSTLPKGSRLQDYTESAEKPVPGGAEEQTTLETQIGVNGTLRTVVLRAKAAVMYPNHGLHTLITGSVGVGKMVFAHLMHQHAISKGKLASDAPFITVNCEHSSDPYTLLNELFGYSRSAAPNGDKSRRGLVERAAGGILCLVGIEKLPPPVHDALLTLLEKNTYTRAGESSVIRYANTMVIGISTIAPDEAPLSTLQQRFAVQLRIPDLREWTLYERAEILIQTFQKEAASTGLSFRLNRDAFAAFLSAPYHRNLGDLISAVRTTCAVVYLDFASVEPRPKLMEISLHHLLPEFMQEVHDDPQKKLQIQNLFSELLLEYFNFTPEGFSSNRFTQAQLLGLLHREPDSSAPYDASPAAGKSVPILAVFHGRNIAEDMAEYVNTALGQPLVTGLNYAPGDDLEELLQRAAATAHQMDHGTGVLIAVDMEPLQNLHESITRITGTQAETIVNVGLPQLLEIGSYALREDTTLATLTAEAMTIVDGAPVRTENSFLSRIVNEILAPSLTFLNPKKATEILSTALNGLLEELGITSSNDITVKFIFHCSHMLERLIRNDSLKYEGLKSFVNRNSDLMFKLEKHMRYPAEVFGVSISANEMAYIAEILLPYLS